jgi:tripartite-type tricarboxylate transporter receptor subunit TctC
MIMIKSCYAAFLPKNSQKNFIFILLFITCWTALISQAQTFPTKPIRIVLPYPTGGGSDVIARQLAQKLSVKLKQPVFVDNRGGASGNIGMEFAAKSAPDGYTLLLALTTQLSVNVSVFDKLNYDPIKDFVPINLLGEGPYILAVHPSTPIKSMSELIIYAKQNPDQLTYATSGKGSGPELATQLLQNLAQIELKEIPYKGGGPALADVLAGHVNMIFSPPLVAAGHIQQGKLRPLAVSTLKRSSGFAQIPTIAESGLADFDASVWYGVLAPKGTSPEIITKLNLEINDVLQQSEMKNILKDNGVEPIQSGPEDLAKKMLSETTKWAKVLKSTAGKKPN